MRAKSLVLFVIAIGCGLAASIGVSQYMETASGPTQDVETEKILVAMTDISIGDTLDAQTVKLEEWPKDRVPEGAVTSLEEIEGKYPRQRMYEGEPILTAKLMDSNTSVTTTIKKGYRAVAVKVSADAAGGGLIQPGDRVDVLVILRKSQEIPQTGTRTILRDVNVFGVDGATERNVDETGLARNFKHVTLMLKPSQAESVTLAQELGQLSLIVRRPDDDLEDHSQGQTVESLLGNAGESANENKQANQEDSGFAAWLNTVKGEKDQTPQPQDTTLVTVPAVEEPEWEMVVMGPNGSTKFHWMDKDDLPIQGEFGATPAAAPTAGYVPPTVPLTAPQPAAPKTAPSGPPAAPEEITEEDDSGQPVAPH